MNFKIKHYAERVKRLSLYSASNILKLGVVFHDCKIDLSKNDYELFLNITDYKSKGSSERKWRQIGENYTKLKPIVNNLPPCWTTVHYIATRKDYEFDLLERNDILSQTVTLKEITDFLSKKSNARCENVHFKLKFDPSITPEELIQIFIAIELILPKEKCNIVYNKTTEQLLDIGSNNQTQFTKQI